MHGLVVLFVRLKGREVLEVGEHRKRHLRSHVRDLDFAHHEPQILHRSDTASAAISDKPRRLVVPFVEEKVDRILQRRRSGMVVLGGDENVGVERGNFLTPMVRVRLTVLMHRRGYRLIEERKFVILDIDNLKLRVLAAFQDIVQPRCDGRGFPSRSRTANNDSNLQHLLLSPFLYGWELKYHAIKVDAEPSCQDATYSMQFLCGR